MIFITTQNNCGDKCVSKRVRKYINPLFLKTFLLAVILGIFSRPLYSQGTWNAVTDSSPDLNVGVMLLLTDGTVICKSTKHGPVTDYGNLWNRLTPDIHGSYAHGTW